MRLWPKKKMNFGWDIQRKLSCDTWYEMIIYPASLDEWIQFNYPKILKKSGFRSHKHEKRNKLFKAQGGYRKRRRESSQVLGCWRLRTEVAATRGQEQASTAQRQRRSFFFCVPFCWIYLWEWEGRKCKMEYWMFIFFSSKTSRLSGKQNKIRFGTLNSHVTKVWCRTHRP